MIRYISALLLLLIIACKHTAPEQLLSGNWHFFTIEYEEKVSPELQPIVDSQIAQLRQNFYIEYLKDFTYHAHSFKDEKGKWKLQNDGQILIHSDHEGEQKYEVLKLDNDSLHLRTTLQGKTFTLKFFKKN